MIVGDDVRRFWSKTMAIDGCIIWIGARNKQGYGAFLVGPRTTRKVVRAHRWIYQRIFGELPPSIGVLHSCDVRACVKLQHLSPGDQAANMTDMVSKGRHVGYRKLSLQQVEEIRDLLRRGLATQATLATRYGVDQSTISHVWTSFSWKPR